MTGCQHPVISTAEAEVAVGALTGVPPAQIMRFALIVLDDDGEVHVSTSCCKEELPQLIGRAGLIAVADAAEAGPCEHGKEPRP